MRLIVYAGLAGVFGIALPAEPADKARIDALCTGAKCGVACCDLQVKSVPEKPQPPPAPTPVDAKLTSTYWHAAFDALQAAQAKERADAAMQAAADAIKASCAGEIRPEGRDFVCVPKPPDPPKPEAPPRDAKP